MFVSKNWDLLGESADLLSDWLDGRELKAAVTLGSGWRAGLSRLKSCERRSFTDFPAMGEATVAGHDGEVVLGQNENDDWVLCFNGRRHMYELESNDITPVIAPVYLARAGGAQTMVLTTAVGGINRDAGDFTLISDHINYSGVNPLSGRNNDDWGARFPDQSEIYSESLRKKAHCVGQSVGIRNFCDAVHLGVFGPTFETPAEVKTFGEFGADTVSMSTVVEAMFANAGGMGVLGMAFVVNKAAGLFIGKIEHADIEKMVESKADVMARLVLGVLNEL